MLCNLTLSYVSDDIEIPNYDRTLYDTKYVMLTHYYNEASDNIYIVITGVGQLQHATVLKFH
jgi:hypothetical protein